jgi:hypothetical protein
MAQNRSFSDFFEIKLEMFTKLKYICQKEILAEKNYLGCFREVIRGNISKIRTGGGGRKKSVATNLKSSLFLSTWWVINKNILARSRSFILVEKSMGHIWPIPCYIHVTLFLSQKLKLLRFFRNHARNVLREYTSAKYKFGRKKLSRVF